MMMSYSSQTIQDQLHLEFKMVSIILKMDIVEAEHTSDLILKFDNAELDGLSHSEKSAYSILERFSDNGILNVSRLSSKRL